MNTSKENMLQTLSKQLQTIGEIRMTQSVVNVTQTNIGIQISIESKSGQESRELPIEVKKALIEKSKKDLHKKTEFAKEEMAASIYLYLMQKYGTADYSQIISTVVNVVYSIFYEGTCSDLTHFLMGVLHLNHYKIGSIDGEPWMCMAALLAEGKTKELLEWAEDEAINVKFNFDNKTGHINTEYLSALNALIDYINPQSIFTKYSPRS